LRRQFFENSSAASSVQAASINAEIHAGGRLGAPAFTVSAPSACTTMPGSCPYTGTAIMSPSSSAVAPTNTCLPANNSRGTCPSKTSTYET
jgi:hypothetical protein